MEISSLSSVIQRIHSISDEYLEAQQSLAVDIYDVTAWEALLSEVEQGRGAKDVTFVETCCRYLALFPRAARTWVHLAEYYIHKQDFSAADELFSKCITKCRNVDLWMSYLRMIKRQTVGAVAKQMPEQHSLARKALEAAFERATENVGLSGNSGPLWREYVEFVRDWPDASGMDPGRKLQALRIVYQRALCIPMDALDTLWKEYESLEKHTSENLAKEVLPDVERKYLSAKALFKERKRIISKIFFDRLAVPPSRSRVELEQLDHWNSWIR